MQGRCCNFKSYYTETVRKNAVSVNCFIWMSHKMFTSKTWGHAHITYFGYLMTQSFGIESRCTTTTISSAIKPYSKLKIPQTMRNSSTRRTKPIKQQWTVHKEIEYLAKYSAAYNSGHGWCQLSQPQHICTKKLVADRLEANVHKDGKTYTNQPELVPWLNWANVINQINHNYSGYEN
jgi:hypothetical protein